MKSNLDKYDLNIILLAKGWFDEKITEEQIDTIEVLKRIFSKRCGIDIKFVSDYDIFSYILNEIVQPFVLPDICRIEEFISDAAPTQCWKVGYKNGNEGFWPKEIPVNPEYNYIHAWIYNCLSKISIITSNHFPGLNANYLDLTLID